MTRVELLALGCGLLGGSKSQRNGGTDWARLLTVVWLWGRPVCAGCWRVNREIQGLRVLGQDTPHHVCFLPTRIQTIRQGAFTMRYVNRVSCRKKYTEARLTPKNSNTFYVTSKEPPLQMVIVFVAYQVNINSLKIKNVKNIFIRNVFYTMKSQKPVNFHTM